MTRPEPSDPAKLTGRLREVCGSCKKPMGEKPCLPEHDGKETTGLCERCFERGLKEIAEGR